MSMVNHPHRKLNGGHYPGHYRDTFLDAVEAFEAWNEGEPEPTVEYEINYVPRQITISQACGLVWNCTDILPGLAVTSLEWCGIELGCRTYAAAARALKLRIVAE